MDLTTTGRRAAMLPARLTRTRAIECFLDPLVIVATLALSAAIRDSPLSGHYLLVALLAFSVNFPGRAFLSEPDRIPASRTFMDWALFATMLFVFGYASSYVWYFPPGVLLMWVVVTPFAIIWARIAVTRALRSLYSLESRSRSAVIVGCNAAGLRLADNFANQPLLGIRCVGFFDDRRAERLQGLLPGQLLGNFAQLPNHVRAHRIDHIYLALPMATQPRVIKVLDELQDTTASVFFVPDVFVTDLIQGRVYDVGGMPVLAVRDTPLRGISASMKRVLDILVSVGLVIVLSPVLLACAIAVRLSSPGPIIFKQCRYGLDGRPILVYKFRTMTVTEDGDKQYKQVIRNDPRVTRIGASLRRLSLDELPQLFNVLAGHMSLVGPRPHAVAVNEQYRRLIPGYMVRHKVKPGITGWAQVNGYRGGDDLESMKKRIDYDMEYLRGWSLGLDLVILFKTARVLLGRDTTAF
jgi:putative colanic acid biosysnthesis UDP-glucose lipid carrier transferase